MRNYKKRNADQSTPTNNYSISGGKNQIKGERRIMKLNDKEFEDLLNKHSANKLIYLHTMSKITLTGKQINHCIKLKNGEIR